MDLFLRYCIALLRSVRVCVRAAERASPILVRPKTFPGRELIGSHLNFETCPLVLGALGGAWGHASSAGAGAKLDEPGLRAAAELGEPRFKDGGSRRVRGNLATAKR